jgi:hypothetical protein
MKRRLNSGNTSYHSVHNLLSSRMLSINIKVNMQPIILPFVPYGCETWSLKLREEHKLRVKNSVCTDITPCGSRNNWRFRWMSVLTTSTQRNIPDDGIFHIHRRENLRSYINWDCSRTGCWKEYWDRSGLEWRGWIKLHNEELHDLYSSPSIIWNIKSRRVRRRGTCIGYWWESQKKETTRKTKT